MTVKDLADYRAVVREPLCFDYAVAARDYRICGMPPPSSGTLAIGQILGLLSHTPAASLPLQAGLPSSDWLHLYTEASRLAFADRDHYVADPDFVPPPAGSWQSLLQPSYLAQRAKQINTSTRQPAHGRPRTRSTRPATLGALRPGRHARWKPAPPISPSSTPKATALP